MKPKTRVYRLCAIHLRAAPSVLPILDLPYCPGISIPQPDALTKRHQIYLHTAFDNCDPSEARAAVDYGLKQTLSQEDVT